MGRQRIVLPLDEIAEAYGDGISIAFLAEYYGVSYPTMWKRLDELGLIARTRKQLPKPKPKVRVPFTTEDLVELYRNGLTYEEIGERFGITREAVRQRLVRAGVATRRNGQGAGALWRYLDRLVERQPDRADFFGADVPFANLSDLEIEALELALMRARFVDFIMTHDGDGQPLSYHAHPPLRTPTPMVSGMTTRVNERWEGMDDTRTLFRSGPCYSSMDGGQTWHRFEPKKKEGGWNHHVLFQHDIAGDLRAAGLIPRAR